MYRVLLLPMMCCVCAGCGLQRTSQPFHMYSASALEYQTDYRAKQKQEQQAYAERKVKHDASAGMYAKRKRGRRKARTSRINRAGASRQTRRKATKRSLPSLSTTRRARMPSPGDSTSQHRLSQGMRTEPAAQRDAAAFVWHAFNDAKRPLPVRTKNDISAMFRHCKKRGVLSFKRVKVGDMVFFHNTFDANDDGRNNDWYTHVGIATNVDGRTITIASYQSGKVHRTVMNTKHPSAAWLHGQRINTQMRPKHRKDLAFTQYMAGELFAGACAILPRKAITPNLKWAP